MPVIGVLDALDHLFFIVLTLASGCDHRAACRPGRTPRLAFAPEIVIETGARNHLFYSTPVPLYCIPHWRRHQCVFVGSQATEHIHPAKPAAECFLQVLSKRTEGVTPTAHWIMEIVKSCCHVKFIDRNKVRPFKPILPVLLQQYELLPLDGRALRTMYRDLLLSPGTGAIVPR